MRMIKQVFLVLTPVVSVFVEHNHWAYP